MQGCVPERLQAAEVDGGHELGPPVRKRFHLDARHDARVRSGGSQRDDKSTRIEERRVKLGGEPAQSLERIARISPDLVEKRTGGGRIRFAEPAGQLKVDRDRDELLLHTVVELPLERAPLRISGINQASARSMEVVDLGRRRSTAARAPVQLSVMAGRASRGQASSWAGLLARCELLAGTLGRRTGTS